MNASYASQALKVTVAQVLTGTRDLTSSDIDPFYAAPAGSQRNLESRYEVVSEFRTSQQLPEVPAARFSADATPANGDAMFQRVQNGQGIETTFSEDLITSDVFSLAPDHLAAFIATEGRKVTPDTTALASKLAFAQPPASLHLTEDEQVPTADNDSLTYRRMQGMFDYTRILTK
jgi:hypothetical protein